MRQFFAGVGFELEASSGLLERIWMSANNGGRIKRFERRNSPAWMYDGGKINGVEKKKTKIGGLQNE